MISISLITLISFTNSHIDQKNFLEYINILFLLDIFNSFINRDTDTKLLQYLAFKQKKITKLLKKLFLKLSTVKKLSPLKISQELYKFLTLILKIR